jgi:acetoin utilization protein AcuC
VPHVSITLPGPLLVFGPRSLEYDFGPQHPLTPLRFRPGIDLLRAVGAAPSLEPSPAGDAALETVHLPAYVEAVRRFSADPTREPAMGIGIADNPAFPGMHDAGASVADGSLRAMEAILRGDVEHAFHPGGGLHHAMPAKAWGFCIYNDPALAIMRARADGLRVLYVDLDTHHGDGVEAVFAGDPGVLTISVHESGRYLFPGTGFVDDLGEGAAAGSAVNVPLEPYTGETAWLACVRSLLPALAATFGPDVIVSQHGADTHAWDPLAHLRVTTTAMGAAARLVDSVAHRWAGGRWLSTGGGGYDAYRVVPRAWALTWLAGAHREAPVATPAEWRSRWEAEASAFGTPGMPAGFEDPPNAGQPILDAQAAAEAASMAVLARVRRVVLPRLVLEAEDRGWWSADAPVPAVSSATASPEGSPSIRALDAASLASLAVEPRTVSPFDPVIAQAVLVAAAHDGARVVGAVAGSSLVGVAAADPTGAILALGVAPSFRRGGLATALLRTLVDGRPAGAGMTAEVGVAERDWVEPLDVEVRRDVARRLLTGAGFEFGRVSPDLARDDPWAIAARLAPR